MGIKISTRAPHKGTLLNESPLSNYRSFLSGNDCCAATQRAKNGPAKSDVHRLGAKAKRPVNRLERNHPAPLLAVLLSNARAQRLSLCENTGYWALVLRVWYRIPKYLFITSFRGTPKLIDGFLQFKIINFTVSLGCSKMYSLYFVLVLSFCITNYTFFVKKCWIIKLKYLSVYLIQLFSSAAWEPRKTLPVMHYVRRSPKLSLPSTAASVLADAAPIFSARQRYYFSPFSWLDPSWYSANTICPIIYHTAAGECIISPDFIRASSPLHNNSRTFFSPLYFTSTHISSRARTHTYTHSRSLAFSIPVHLLFSACAVCAGGRKKRKERTRKIYPLVWRKEKQ